MKKDINTVLANLKANSHLLDDIKDPKKLIDDCRGRNIEREVLRLQTENKALLIELKQKINLKKGK